MAHFCAWCETDVRHKQVQYWHISKSTKHYDKRGLSDQLNALPRGGWVTVCATDFNIQTFYVLPTQGIYVFRVDLWTNYYLFQHAIVTDYAYNGDEMRLLRGTIPIFKYNLGSEGGFSRPPLTAVGQARSHSVHMRFVIDKVAMG